MVRWRLRDTELELEPGRPLGLGIVNATDDSFFAGARSGTPEQAISDGLALVEAGFDMLDVGAVAARGGPPVHADDETARLIPAIAALAGSAGVPITADTFNPEVADRAIAAGAAAINDIGGGDPAMLEVVAATGCGYVLMHIEGPPRVDRPAPDYSDVVAHLVEWFGERLALAEAHGVDRAQVAIDPGLDFDLTTDDNLEILRRLDQLHELGCAVFISLSRKDFLGAVLAGSWTERLAPSECEAATCAATSLAAAAGAQLHRLHDPSALDAMRVAARIAHG